MTGPKYLRRLALAHLVVGAVAALVACGGGGGGDLASQSPSSPNGVVIAEGSGIAAASLGDTQQRIFVIPGETTGRTISIVPSAPGALFDVTVAAGEPMLATSERGGRHVITIDASSLIAGSTYPYKVVIRNRASGATAEITGQVHVLTPAIVATGSIGEAGGAIGTQSGDLRVEFDPQPGALPLGVTVRVAEAPSGAKLIRVKFDRDVSTDTRLVRFVEPQSTALGRAVALAAGHPPKVASFPTLVWNFGVAYYLDNGNYRIPGKASLAALNKGSCFWKGDFPREICVTARRAWDLSAPTEEGLRIATERNAVPVLFVHGFQPGAGDVEIRRDDDTGNGGAGYWGEFPLRLQELDARRVVPFEFRWYTNARFEDVADELAAAINLIHTRTGGKRVTIVAHSFGGVLARTMLQGLGTLNVSDKVEQLITLGTPHSGIADKPSTMHGASLPRGQDSLAFEACEQISCHQMGEPVDDIADDVDFARLLGIDVAPGELAARLASTKVNAPASNVHIAAGIGLALDKFPANYVYRDGDALISWAGQRILPSDGLNGTALLNCADIGQSRAKEVLLSGDDGRRPKRSLALSEYSDSRKGHGHSVLSVAGASPASIFVNVREAELRVDDCSSASTCAHASFKLVKEALVDGICRPPLITGQSPQPVVQVGQTASFAVSAVSAGPLGGGALTYQWLRSPDRITGPSGIAGATAATYDLPSVSLADDGWIYWVLVKGSDGSGTLSQEFELRVSALPPPPAVDCGAQAVSWTQGTLTCNASYAGGKSGTSALLSDVTAPTTGTATANCTNGVINVTSPTCSTAPPPPPALVAPTALAPTGTIATLTPVFSWSGGSGAANYEINVRDLTTNVIVLKQQGISTSSTSFTMPAATLVNARQYRWNITACPDFACSSGYVTSGDLTFTTPATTTGPLITSFAVSPVTLSVGIPVVFTFTGTDLPPGLVLSFPGCSAVIVNGWTTTLQQYACTLMQSGVNFQGTITTFSGNVLYTFHQSVVPTVIGVGPGGLFVGYYAEDPITNPEDPGVGALYLRFPASPGPFAGAMYFTVAGCQTNNVGAISGTKTDAGIAGSWSGTVDGVIQSGAYSGIYSSTLGAYSGDYTVSGGKQFITVANCLQYWVAPKGTWEVTAIGDGVPTAFRLTTIGTTVMWTPRVGAVITHVSVIDEADALAGGANAIKYQAYSVQGAPTFNLASIPGLVAGRSYVVAVTTTTSNNQRTGVASARIVLATSVSTFFDDFSRPDGPVGNGWQTGTGRTAGDLVLVGGKLTTPVTAGDWLMYRPFDISGGVSVSFTITETAGSTLTGGRYESAVWMGSTGAYLTGYGLYIVHSGNGVDNSGVYLYLNGTQLAFIPSPFQFGQSIDVNASFATDGTVSGIIRGSGQTFNFNFGPRAVNLATLPGKNVLIEFENGSCCFRPTIDNFSLTP